MTVSSIVWVTCFLFLLFLLLLLLATCLPSRLSHCNEIIAENQWVTFILKEESERVACVELWTLWSSLLRMMALCERVSFTCKSVSCFIDVKEGEGEKLFTLLFCPVIFLFFFLFCSVERCILCWMRLAYNFTTLIIFIIGILEMTVWMKCTQK